MPELLTLKEAAERMGVSYRQIYLMKEAGNFPVRPVVLNPPNGLKKYPAAEVDRLVEKRILGHAEPQASKISTAAGSRAGDRAKAGGLAAE